MTQTPPLLQIDNVGYRYDVSHWQLAHVSLRVAPGEILGIIGPNGAGKSTLLKIAAGILRPHDGSVRLLGKNLRHLPRRGIARHLGFLPQNVVSSFDYRVEEVVAMGRFCHLRGAGFLRPEDTAVIERCMDYTEITAYRHRPLSHLSGGERQRVLLASVLVQQPRILLLDEPSTGLDLHYQIAFFQLLRSLAADGLAVVVVTHELNLASLFCGRLLLLQNGQTVKEGPVEEVIHPDVLCNVYHAAIYVGPHPINGRPITLPLVDPPGALTQKEDQP